MPRATNRYTFEYNIMSWLYQFSEKQPNPSVFIELDDAGNICKIHSGWTSFPKGDETYIRMVDKLKEKKKSWIFYDPFEPHEYTWVEWKNVPKAVFEKLMGCPISNDDLAHPYFKDRRIPEFPETWGVMF